MTLEKDDPEILALLAEDAAKQPDPGGAYWAAFAGRVSRRRASRTAMPSRSWRGAFALAASFAAIAVIAVIGGHVDTSEDLFSATFSEALLDDVLGDAEADEVDELDSIGDPEPEDLL